MKTKLKRLLLTLLVLSMIWCAPMSVQAVALKAPTGVKAASAEATSVVLKWKKVPSAKGYKVYRSLKKGSGYKMIAKLTTNKYPVYAAQNLTSGRKYYFKIAAYSGKKQKMSKVVTCTPKPCKVSWVRLINRDDKAVNIHWHNQFGVSGYQIYRSTNKDKGYKLIGTAKSRQYTDKKSINKLTRYYYKVRAYTKYKKATYYGAFSNAESILLDEAYWHAIAGKHSYRFGFDPDKITYDYDDDNYKYYRVPGNAYEDVQITAAVGNTFKPGRTVTVKYYSAKNIVTTDYFSVVSNPPPIYGNYCMLLKKRVQYKVSTGETRTKTYKGKNYYVLWRGKKSKAKQSGNYKIILAYTSSDPVYDYDSKMYVNLCASDDTIIYSFFANDNFGSDPYVPSTQAFDCYDAPSYLTAYTNDGYLYQISENV